MISNSKSSEGLSVGCGGKIDIGNVLRRMLVRMLETRSPSAERMATIELEGLSNAQLCDLGYSEADIASFRAGRPVSSILARD